MSNVDMTVTTTLYIKLKFCFCHIVMRRCLFSSDTILESLLLYDYDDDFDMVIVVRVSFLQ